MSIPRFSYTENPMKVQLLFLELILCHILTCAFIRDTRYGLYEVHLSYTLDEMCKNFFAHVKEKYAILVPVYLAEMRALKLEYIRSLWMDTEQSIRLRFHSAPLW